MHRTGRGLYRYAPPGKTPPGSFRVHTTSEEAARRACQEFAREDLRHGAKPRKSQRVPIGLYRRGTKEKFPCGHRRIPENSYQTATRKICRICTKRKALAYYREHRAAIRAKKASLWKEALARTRGKLTPEELQRHEVARLIYQQLRWLMRRDGMWAGREPLTEEES